MRDLTNRCLVFASIIGGFLVLTGCSSSSSDKGPVVLANAGCFTTPQEQSLAGRLTATGSLLTYSIVTNGSKGTATIIDATTGDFAYTPSLAGIRGVDTFTYQVEDPNGIVDTAAVTVIIDLKMMPLGDSITAGFITSGNPPVSQQVGYRKPLYDALLASSFNVDFVGTQTHGSSVANFDFHHEGHGGWRDDEIAWGRGQPFPDGIFEWLQANPADIVLLHIGTNGLDPTPNDVTDILNEIDRWEVSAGGNPVTVMLARIIDQDPFGGTVTPFNNNVVAMAQARTGDKIFIVDQQTALVYPPTVPNDMADNKHPIDAGYGKMATVWFNRLTGLGLVPKCP